MNERTVEQLCHRFSLGNPIAHAERITGGLTHQMYHIRTSQGEFAVKVLNPLILANPDALARFRLSERIAATIAAAGIPAVAALEAQGDVLQTVDSTTVLVYPWIDGRPLPSTSAGEDRAIQIGELLGCIHTLPLAFPELEPPPKSGFSNEQWSLLVNEAENWGADWASTLRSALPDLARWGKAMVEAQTALGETWVVSHADLHQQNVLWLEENTPYLIDWESAGLQQPAKEAVVCALEWSGFVEGEPDLATFRAFLRGYRRKASLSPEAAMHGLRACFGNWLGWLHWCARRALDDVDPTGRAEGARQVGGTLATVRRAEANFPVLDKECRADSLETGV